MTRVRIVRIDPRAMLRFAVLFAVFLWLMLVVAGVALWVVAALTGTLGRIEDFIGELLAERTFRLDAVKVLLGAGATGVVLLLTSAILAAIMSALFNLVAGRVGGLGVTVAEVDEATVFPRG